VFLGSPCVLTVADPPWTVVVTAVLDEGVVTETVVTGVVVSTVVVGAVGGTVGTVVGTGTVVVTLVGTGTVVVTLIGTGTAVVDEVVSAVVETVGGTVGTVVGTVTVLGGAVASTFATKKPETAKQMSTIIVLHFTTLISPSANPPAPTQKLLAPPGSLINTSYAPD
jgi:hypothetical protein